VTEGNDEMLTDELSGGSENSDKGVQKRQREGERRKGRAAHDSFHPSS
jgi:hypothetical protein